MALLPLLLLGALLPDFSCSARVDVGIINGTEAKPHSRPYMVSIQEEGQHICGGFLVSDRFVMTAAHCWDRVGRLIAVLGAHDLSNPREGAIRMGVEKYHPHPWYNPKTLDYDIMLLKLLGTARKTPTVNWIPIPQKDEDIPDKTVCNVAGWGKTGTYKPPSARLLETSITIIGAMQCRRYWQNFTPRMVCAVHPGGICMGDSGGPLVCGNTAVGIASFIDGELLCDKPYAPNVYSKISAFLPWIRSVMGK